MTTVSVRKPSLFLMVAAALSLLLSSMFAVPAGAAQTKGQQVASYALKLSGSPYKYGGTTPKGFDASGFTQYVYEKSVKVKLPRTSPEQYKQGTAIKASQLKPGDLVFYKTNGKTVSFVGIYLGQQQFIGATSKGVRVQSMKLAYWKDCYAGARRIVK
ncbi:C40 family peptidase [Mesobacillus foraminis]|uniref:C40 family peptidase n=1 Tax=Mesobacillus foraminis TaxID=279826 RepID=UPI001BE695CF|nr:C40 family peptidase [Mesobacillus foraminis]MBT2757005.1 C40 family peptidase [Mesobacillus foraminis]